MPAPDLARLVGGTQLTRCVLYDCCDILSCEMFEECLTDPKYTGLEDTILTIKTPVHLALRAVLHYAPAPFPTVDRFQNAAETAFPRLHQAGRLTPVELENDGMW